ncbi:hypothetical protein CBL_03071 [Carabus blaptoides fortunei]
MSVRSHLISKYRELMKRPLDDVSRCSTCGTDFKTTLPNHHIEPVLAVNRFQRRHLRDEQCKTKYQALRMKQFHKKIHNQQKLVTVCTMCKKTHTTKLTKPSNIITTKVIKLSNNERKNVKKKLKRLQRKKNRAFAGLNENVVLSVVNNLKNSIAPSAVVCLSDTASPSTGDNSVNNVDRSPIIISDSPHTKLQSVIELSGSETDKSVILLGSPNSANSKQQDSDIFFIDTTPSTSSAKTKKRNKPAPIKSVKSLNSKLTAITPTVARSSNTNIKQVQKNHSPKLKSASTSKQNVVKKKTNKNKILVQPMKKDKKSQKLNSLSNLLNNNNLGTRTKSTSMLTEFLKTIR